MRVVIFPVFWGMPVTILGVSYMYAQMDHSGLLQVCDVARAGGLLQN